MRQHLGIKWILVPVFMGLTNCQKIFDEPPAYTVPALEANTTIKALKQLHIPNNFEKILDNLVIEGIVTANDEKDNFYKSIVLQDSSGGIMVRLDGFSLYKLFPVGKKIGIKLRGLWMGDYGGTIQIGAGVDRSDSNAPQLLLIPQPLFSRYLVTGKEGEPVIPKSVRIQELDDSLQNMLINLQEVELADDDTGKAFADAVNKLSVSRSLKTCGIGTVYLRTSGFARFAAQMVPRGHGSVTGIFTQFRTQKQLVIRDTSDVQMNGLRCTLTGPKLFLQESFTALQTDTIAQINGWKNINEVGGAYFMAKKNGNNQFVDISAFATRQPVVITWLILPVIDLDHSANEVLRFKTKDGFDNGAVLQVLVSANYDGGNIPWKAKWTPLTATISKGTRAGYANNWIVSGDVGLHHLKGKIWIAFRYEGNDPPAAISKLTTSFQLDEISIWGN